MSKSTSRCLLSLAVCILASACSGGTEKSGGARPAARALPVRLGNVAVRDVVYQVEALGSLEPVELGQITAEVAGAVKEVRFQAGDRVGPTSVLARIDPDRYRLEAATAEAAHRKAVADARRAEAELARREALAREKLLAEEELVRARIEAERLAAEAASAQASLELARLAEQRSAVRPPRAGEINTRSVDTGQFVSIGTVLATLVDLDRLRLRFKVSDVESLRAEKNPSVRFRVATLGDREFAATVYHVGAVADPATRQVEVLAWVDNPGDLRPGFFAEVRLATEVHRGALVVPESAIQASERGFVVYAVEDGVARIRPVQIGLRTGDGAVEVISGLAAGAAIVVEGSDRLSDGIGVREAGADGSTGAPGSEPAKGGRS